MLLLLAALAQLATALATLDPRWTVTLDQPPAAAPAFDTEAVYVPLRGGGLAAVDLARGRVRWQQSVATTIPPATGVGLVFVATDGGVDALSALTGRSVWQTSLPGPLVTITWDTGWLLCSNAAGDVAALRASDGTLVWRASLGAPLVTAPAAGLDRIYVGLDGGRVVSLGLASGAETWARTVPGRVTSLQAVDGQLIVGTTGNAVFSLDLASGRQRWRWRIGGDVAGRATADDRHIYFTARDNVVRAVDRGNGNLRWTAELPSRPVGGPQLLDGAVLVPMATAIASFDPATGKALGSVPIRGEMRVAPHLRASARPTGPRMVTLTLDGRLQAFAPRIEAPPALIDGLPGVVVVP